MLSRPNQNFSRLREGEARFRDELEAVKAAEKSVAWYPYGTMSNLDQLAALVDPVDDLFSTPRRFADIGAADGDLAFFLERGGHDCDIYDFAPTNYNGLRGARHLKQTFFSAVNIYEVDLDSQFSVGANYDLIFMLGILYHLKNPFYVLEKLAAHSEYLFISTRICRHFHDGSADVSSSAAAYLLNPDESNNDATNYWIFTEAGLKRIVDRSGWNVVAFHTVGDLERSNPQSLTNDQRAFALLRRK